MVIPRYSFLFHFGISFWGYSVYFMNIKYVTLETNILLHVKPESNKYTVGGEKNRFFQNA